MVDALTDEVIAEAMARAEKVACRPGDDRCYAFVNRLEAVSYRGHPKGHRGD
jgi:hypothetical protein